MLFAHPRSTPTHCGSKQAAYLAGLTKEAGFPDGVVQIISGGGETGKLLAEHPLIRKISFTGSVATGKAGAFFLFFRAHSSHLD
jgi:acyl-CoA reductase-like NAD-dependent aldehyde dehydrogenase